MMFWRIRVGGWDKPWDKPGHDEREIRLNHQSASLH
jgi:hypothetical protein